MISPISIQLINHKKLNFHNYSLDCSTIDGRAKILEILNNNQIEYSDPLDLFLETEKIDVKENNFEPLFLSTTQIIPMQKVICFYHSPYINLFLILIKFYL